METGKAHHKAFIKTNGVDPEWPLWYAEFIIDKLKKLLQADFTRSELIYLLIFADNEQRSMAPGSKWNVFYAQFFLDRYNPEGIVE